MQKKHGVYQSNTLTRIRQNGTYSSTNLIRGAMVREMHTIFSEYLRIKEKNNLKNGVMIANITNKKSFHNRENVWRIFDQRYLSCPPWILLSIARSTKEGIQSVDFIGQTYLYFVFRERLVYEFVTEFIWIQWKNKKTKIESADAIKFLVSKGEEIPVIKQWSEKTIQRSAQSILRSLRDFGLLKGSLNKTIQKPSISLEAVFQLLCVLKSEEIEGRGLIEAKDWRLFLLNDIEVIDLFNRLAMKGWIRFERSGPTTIIEIIRNWEGGE